MLTVLTTALQCELMHKLVLSTPHESGELLHAADDGQDTSEQLAFYLCLLIFSLTSFVFFGQV